MLKELAHRATDCLLAQSVIVITHPAGWKRPIGFPLPIKRMAPDADGSTTQSFRPIAVLEYVQEAANTKPAVAKGEPELDDLFGDAI